MENGKIIIWKVEESINGLMVVSIEAIIMMIVKKAMENTSGVMAVFIKVSGNKANKMVMEFIINLIHILNVANGRMARESNGLKTSRLSSRLPNRSNRMLLSWTSSLILLIIDIFYHIVLL